MEDKYEQIQIQILFCKIFAGFGSTNKTATCCLFSSHQSLALALSHFPFLRSSFYLTLSGKNHLFSSSPLLSGCNTSMVTQFFRGMTRQISWPGGVRYSGHSFSYAISPLLLGLDAYCIIRILRHTGSLSNHRGTCGSCCCCVLSRLYCDGNSLVLHYPLSNRVLRSAPVVI